MPPAGTKRKEEGAALITVIMVLALLTIAGFSAARNTDVERRISVNHLLHQQTFFAAAAGIDHAVRLLEKRFQEANRQRLRSGANIDWNFAFMGGDQKADTPDDAVDFDGDGQGSYAGAALWIAGAVIDGLTYRVRLWNNDETGSGGAYDDDRDGLVWLRSEASGPRGGRSSVQILLQGTAVGLPIDDYPAQAGAGAAKNYVADDLNPIMDFSRQL